MNAFEITARAEKVAKIVALVPRRFTSSRNNAARTAARMERFTAEQRDRWALAAGAHPASDETWAMVVAAVRVRYPRVHRHDFSDGDICNTCDAMKRLEVV